MWEKTKKALQVIGGITVAFGVLGVVANLLLPDDEDEFDGDMDDLFEADDEECDLFKQLENELEDDEHEEPCGCSCCTGCNMQRKDKATEVMKERLKMNK